MPQHQCLKPTDIFELNYFFAIILFSAESCVYAAAGVGENKCFWKSHQCHMSRAKKKKISIICCVMGYCTGYCAHPKRQFLKQRSL